MTVNSQTGKRGIVISAAASVAVVLAALGVTAAMQDDGPAAKGTTVEQGAAQGGPATATGPTFLSAADLPTIPEAGTWTEQPVQSGLPDPQYTCISGAVPASGTTYRTFAGDMTAEARELVTVLADADGAQLVAKEVAQSIERCTDTMATQADESGTTWKKYGTYPDVADGLTVYGAFFAPAGSEYHLQLFGVGRDGKNVVVTTLAQMGRESEAPVDAFTATAKVALEKAF